MEKLRECYRLVQEDRKQKQLYIYKSWSCRALSIYLWNHPSNYNLLCRRQSRNQVWTKKNNWSLPNIFLSLQRRTLEEKRCSDSCFDLTMGSYDGAKLCEFIGTCLLEQLYTKINNNDCGLYKDDCLMIQEYINV